MEQSFILSASSIGQCMARQNFSLLAAAHDCEIGLFAVQCTQSVTKITFATFKIKKLPGCHICWMSLIRSIKKCHAPKSFLCFGTHPTIRVCAYGWGVLFSYTMVILVPVRTSFGPCVGVAVKSSDEGLTLETSANTLFTAFSVSTSTLRWYIVWVFLPCWSEVGFQFLNLNYGRLYLIVEHPKFPYWPS